MPNETVLRIGLYLSAIVLLGALATRTSFAEEAGSSAHDDSKPSGTSANAPEKSVNTPDIDGKNPDGVDPRIAVQSGRLGDGRDNRGKVESLAARNSYRRTLSTPRVSNRTVRNPVGMPVTRHEDLGRRDGEPRSSQPAAPVSAPAAGVTPTAAGGLAKTDVGFDRPPVLKPNPNPIIGPTPLNRGTTNGAGQIPTRVGPSGVGGPAKSVAGINGTSIRPRPH
jgi:hypothetical protein